MTTTGDITERDGPSGNGPGIHSLGQLLERMEEAGESDRVSVEEIVAAVGRRSFGPLLLAPALVVVTPLSGIPGLPSICAAIVALVAMQMLAGRDHVWLPRVVRRQRIDRARLRGALRWLQPVARRVDRLIRPRLTFLTVGAFGYAIALACLATAVIMPPLEIVPLSNSVSAATIAVFALALTAHDGALAILGFACVALSYWFGATLILSVAHIAF